MKNTKIVEDHAALVKAIENRDAALAREVMEKHLNRYKVDESAIRATYPQYISQ